MTLTVFGATGRTGRHIVSQALSAGHAVTAFVRNREKLAGQQDLSDERLRVAQGDVQNAAAVEEAVEAADAVLSALGHTKTSADDVQTVGTKNIIAAMQQHGVERIVSETGAGVSDPGDESHLGATIMRGIMKLVTPALLRDAQAHAEALRHSGLDYVIVRAPRLTDGDRTGTYREGHLKLGPTAKIARADVADFMLREATDGRYHAAAPMVSY